MRRAVLAIALAAGIGSEATAAFYSGNELLQMCTAIPRTDEKLYDRASCAGYVAATVDSLPALSILNEAYRICVPGGVTLGQHRDVIVKWLRENPQDRHGAAYTLALRALFAAFPCS